MPTIESIKSLYSNIRTYNNAKSKLKRVNQLLGLTPDNEIHTERYVEQFAMMAHMLLTTPGTAGGMIKSKDELTAFIGAIIGAVTRTLNGEHNPLSTLYAKLRISDIPNPKPEHDAEPWNIVQGKLYEASLFCSNDFGRMVALIYSHGYVLRVGEIFTTSVKPIPGYNHLDLDTGTWTVTNHKNKARGDRKFTVTQELLQAIKPYLNPGCPFMIHKSTLRPYTIQTLAIIGLTDYLPSNSQLRNSYEEWNWNSSKRNREEKLHWSVNVLGHSEHTVQGYYTSNSVESTLRRLNRLEA